MGSFTINECEIAYIGTLCSTHIQTNDTVLNEINSYTFTSDKE